MKKIIVVMFLITMTLAGCGQNKDNIEKVMTLYENANEKQNNVKSSYMKMEEDLTYTIDGEELAVHLKMDVQVNELDSENQEMKVVCNVSSTGTDVTMKMYVKDGYLYVDSLGAKGKQKIDQEEIEENLYLSSMFETRMFDEDKLRKVKVNEKKNQTEGSFDILIDKEDLDEYFSDFMNQSLGDISNFDVEIDTLYCDFVVDKDGYFKKSNMQTTFIIHINDTDELKTKLNIKLDYINNEKQEIEFPDLSEFTEELSE